MEPTNPQFRRPALTGEDNPFDKKGRSYDYASAKSYEDTSEEGSGRNLKVEENQGRRGDAHNSLLESAVGQGGGAERMAKVEKADAANKEEVESANLVAKDASIESLMRGAEMGIYKPMSADAMNRARQGTKPQLRKEI